MSARTDVRQASPARPLQSRSFWGAFLVGAAIMAAVDEIVFHQILAWHHFFDRSTPAIGLLSDGLLHAASLIALVAGFFLLADARRRDALARLIVVAGLFVGLGLFQLFDGMIDHKVLRVHQIRYGVELLPYDLAWIGAGAVLLAIGVVLTVRATRRTPAEN
jgi:uncharacterized membrane protein